MGTLLVLRLVVARQHRSGTTNGDGVAGTLAQAEVDVFVTAFDLTSVRAPSMSITDGSPAARVMMVCCLNTFRPSHVQLAVPVDEMTAQRFQRTCRELTVLVYRIMPGVVIIGVAVALIGMVGRALGDRALTTGCYLVEFTLVAAALIANIIHRLRRSRHHPRVGRGGHILIRGVDRRTAREWVALNSPGDIEVR